MLQKNNNIKILILTCILLFNTNINWCFADNYSALNTKYLNFIKQAQNYEAKSNILKANKAYLIANKIFPKRFEGVFGLAKTYGWTHKDKEAQKYYNQILKDNSNNITVLDFYADYLKNSSKSDLAIEVYKKLLLKTKNNKYNAEIAEIYYRKADYKQAVNYYSKIIQTNQTDETTLKYGKCLFYSRDSKTAKEILESYLLKNNTDNDAKKTLTDIYLSLNEFNNASLLLSAMLKEKPDDIELKTKYAQSLMALNDFKQANLVLKDVISQNTNAENINLYADSCFGIGEFKDASGILQDAVLKYPENIDLKVKLAKSYEAQAKFDEMKPLISEIEQLQDKNVDIFDLLGNYYSYNKDFDKSISYYQKAYSLKNDEYTLFKTALNYSFKNDTVNAEKTYKLLLNSPEWSTKVQTQIGYLRLQQGKTNEAKSIFKDIIAKTNDNEAKIGLAKAYYSNEDYFKSIKTLQTAEQNNKTKLTLANNYAKLLNGSAALNALKNDNSTEAQSLKAKIHQDMQLKIEPIYQLGSRSGDINQHLNSNKYGFTASKSITPNHKVYGNFYIQPFSTKNNKAKSTIYSYSLGAQGKLGLKTNYLSEITLDDFSNKGQAVLGKAILDFKPTDNLKFKVGFSRDHVEDSMLSMSGLTPTAGPLANELVGRVIDNKFLFNASYKMPHQSYIYSGYNLGFKKGANSDANFYQEAMGGLGKILYSAPKGSLLDQAVAGYNIYYTGYNTNKLHYGGADLYFSPIGSDGGNIATTGGYFSPERLISNNISLKLKGSFKPLKLTYSNESYVGVQNIKYTGSDLTWGNTTNLIWNEEGRLGVKLGYTANFYGVAKQQYFSVQLLMRDMLRKNKCSERL